MVRYTGVIALMLSTSFQCFAQSVHEKLLDDESVHDVFTIGEMAFIIKLAPIVNSKVVQTDLAKLVSPEAAVKSGMPNKQMTELIDRLLEGHHKPYLYIASAVNGGDAGYFWELKWHLFPSPGGSSGMPYEYHAVVLSDGTTVKPEIFLFSDLYSDIAEPAKTLFSVLAIDDLLPTTQSESNEDKIKAVAEKSFNDAIQKFKIEEEFRALAPRRQVFSREFATKSVDGGDLEVWAVRFVLTSIENPEDVPYVGSIVVWVTSDLKTSKLTFGSWNTQSMRRKPRAK